MARVFEIPRYKNQTFYKLRLFLEASGCNFETLDFADRNAAEIEPGIAEYEMGILGDMDVSLDGPADEVCDDEANEYMFRRYAYAAGVINARRDNSEEMKLFGIAIFGILSGCATIYTDYAAANMYLGSVLDGRIACNVVGSYAAAQAFAVDKRATCILQSFAANKLGASPAQVALSTGHPWDVLGGQDLWSAYLVLEKMLMGASTPAIVQAHKDVVSLDTTIGSADFVDHNNPVERMSDICCYTKICGLHIIKCKHATFVVDYSTIQMLMECVRGFQMTRVYYKNYRLSNYSADIRSLLMYVNASFDEWCAKALTQNPFCETTARHLKQCIAVMMNRFRSTNERFETGASTREVALLKELKANAPIAIDVLPLLEGLPEHLAYEMLHKFVCFPAPDADPRILFDKTIAALSNSNIVDDKCWKRFMDYSKGIDLVLALQKYGDALKIEQSEGCDFTNSPAYHDIKNNRLNVLPENYVGHVRIRSFFNFDYRIENWFWDVGDVTHILPDTGVYTSHSRSSDLTRVLSNELLYAINYAPVLGLEYSPADVRTMLDTGCIPATMPLLIAAKSENTKSSLKTRETYSANDILREVTAEFDRAAVPLSSLYEASTMRKGSDTINRSVNRILEYLQSESGAVVISLDVSGWSPNANRTKFLEHHRYILETTSVLGRYKIESFWDKIEVVINKRGWIKASPMDSGMFQGFTGSMDTMLHVHVAYYCISEGKRLGIIRPDEAAVVLAMIDDGVICLPFSNSRDNESKRNVSREFYNHIVRTYRTLGLSVDTDKTIVSTSNFVFLNRFYSLDHEVLTALKIICKVDREHTRMFGGTIQQCRTIFENGRNAMARGADAVVVYAICMSMALRIVALTCRSVKSVNDFELSTIAFAPAVMGGLGFPTISQIVCSECPDYLTAYFGGMKESIRYINDADCKAIIHRVMANVLSQTFKRPRAAVFMSTPTDVRVESAPDPEVAAQNAITEILRKNAKSRVFLDLVNVSESERYDDILWEVLKTTSFDASILAAIAGCGPTALVATVIDRARKNELLVSLVGPARRRRIHDKNKYLDYKRIEYAMMLAKQFATSSSIEYVKKTDATTICTKIREQYYHFLGVIVKNHTTPDPITCTVRVTNEDESIMSVHFKKPRAIRGDATTRNPYDSSAGGRRLTHGRSRSSIFSDTSLARAKNICDRVMVEAAAICSYVTMHGGDAHDLWTLVKCMYGAAGSQMVPNTYWAYDKNAATKRIGHLKQKRTHQICVYPNASSCIAIDSSVLEKIFDNVHMSTDFMSYIAGYRAIMLVEGVALNFEGKVLHFGWAIGARPTCCSSTFNVYEREAFDKSCVALSKNVDATVTSIFHAAMKSMVVGSDAGNAHSFLAATFHCGDGPAPNEALLEDVKAIRIRPAVRFDLRATHADIQPTRVVKSLRATIRSNSQVLGEVGAILSTIAGFYMTRYNGFSEDLLFVGMWSEAAEVGRAAVQDPVEAYDYIRDAIGSEDKLTILEALSTSDIGNRVKQRYKRAVAFLSESNENDACYAAGFYLWISFGHYPAASLYPLTARLGYESVRRVHKFAAERYIRRSTDSRSMDPKAMKLRSFLYKASSEMAAHVRTIPAAAEGLINAVFSYMYSEGLTKDVTLPTINVEDVEVSEDLIRILNDHADELSNLMRRLRKGKTSRAGRAQMNCIRSNYNTITEILGDYTLMCAPAPSHQKLFVSNKPSESFKQYCIDLEEDEDPSTAIDEFYSISEAAAIDLYEAGNAEEAYKTLLTGEKNVESDRMRNELDDEILAIVAAKAVASDIAK